MLDAPHDGRTQKTGEAVAGQLRRKIVRGELTIGERLPPEDELTSQLGIARTTLREALRILESQGLLAIKRGRGGGPIVTMPPVDPLAQGLAALLQLQGTTLGDLDEARQLLEPTLAARLATRHTDGDLDALRDAVEAAAAAAKAVDHSAFAAAAANVHETLVERAGNTTLATFSRLLHELVQEYYSRAAAQADEAMMQRAVRSYRKLVRLVEAGDGDAAAAHWRTLMHFTGSRRAANDPLDLFDA